MKSYLTIFGIILIFTGCFFDQQASNTFGDQHFKTAITLIEIHKIRYGAYPEEISDLKFLGNWDSIALQNIEYQKVGKQYKLKMAGSLFSHKPSLIYPEDFWRGLGIINKEDFLESN